ncbi:metallophosphoesterase [Sorangium sp. So ce131]|uniref:metallophosphoesterase n=1 Tax=Sorangium sp. So ce131 TaxID=3133282 RepID=UPI003F6063CD
MTDVLFSWVQLSDIHIGHGDEEHRWDQKLVLDRLREDLPKAMALGAPRPDAIVVTGDIAFSGASRSPTEYDEAKAWLLSAGAAVGLGPERIFLVPGNHDVSRAGDKGRQVARLLAALRSGGQSPDAAIDEALKDAGDRALLAGRMQGYLKLAAEFAPWCGRTPLPPPEERLFWKETIAARGGLLVRFVGLNTALLAADDQDQGRLQLGKQQLHLALHPSRQPNEVIVALSHHPLAGWLSDGAEAERYLQSGAQVHLSGHVHEANFELARRGAGRNALRITAGAAHSDKLPRDIPASHGYNFAAVVRGAGGEAILRVWPRRWAHSSKVFRVDADLLDDGAVSVDNTLDVALPPAPPIGGAGAASAAGAAPPPGGTAGVTAAAGRPAAAAAGRPAAAATGPVELFYFYSPEDDDLRKKLETHLALLRKTKVIRDFSGQSVEVGATVREEVLARIETTRIFLALLSPSFIASDHFDGPEMTRALERVAQREAMMIPIYLKPFDRTDNPLWDNNPISAFQGLPRDGKPVSGRDLDSAFTEVARELRMAIERLGKK